MHFLIVLKGVFHFFNKEKFKSFWPSVYMKQSALHKVIKQRKSGGIIKLSCLVRRKFYCVLLFISFLYFTFISQSHQPPVGNNKTRVCQSFCSSAKLGPWIVSCCFLLLLQFNFFISPLYNIFVTHKTISPPDLCTGINCPSL